MKNIRMFLHRLRVKLFVADINICCFYNGLSNREDLLKYCIDEIEKKFKEKYDVPILYKDIVDMNIGREKISVGRFYYYEGKTIKECKEASINLKLDDFRPRIEIASNSSLWTKCFTLCHEIGHCICHDKNNENTEELADQEGMKFFMDTMNEAFHGIFHNSILVHDNRIDMTDYKTNYLKHYLTLRENNPELNLPLIKEYLL